MALYSNSKDCSCVCKYISIVRHFSEYRNRNAGSVLLLNSSSKNRRRACLRRARPQGPCLATLPGWAPSPGSREELPGCVFT